MTSPAIPRLTNVGRRRTAIEVHQHLRDLILTGRLAPGQILPQIELAKMLGVGVNGVREALRMLQQEGLIDAQPDRRAVVAHMVPEDQDAIWANRILLEGLAARMTAGKLNNDQFKQLDVLLDAMSMADVPEVTSKQNGQPAWQELHRQFHELTYAHAGSALNELISGLTGSTGRYMAIHNRPVPHSLEEATNDHRAIVVALKENDPANAGRIAALHVGRAALILLSQVTPSFEPSAVRAAIVMAAENNST